MGCHIFDLKVIVGGFMGKSFGNSSAHLKKPPSLRETMKGESIRA